MHYAANVCFPPFAKGAAYGSWTKPLARHWRLLRSFYLLI